MDRLGPDNWCPDRYSKRLAFVSRIVLHDPCISRTEPSANDN
jgi:hypothetical protein